MGLRGFFQRKGESIWVKTTGWREQRCEPWAASHGSMGTSLLFSFHYESNLPTILPNNFGITAYLLCVASAHRLCLDGLAEGGKKNVSPVARLNSPPKRPTPPFKAPPYRCVTACCQQRRAVQKVSRLIKMLVYI